MDKKIYRSKNDKKLCGVCGGIGEYFGVDPTKIRIAYALLSVFTSFFPGVVLYIILALIIPEDDGFFDTDVSDK